MRERVKPGTSLGAIREMHETGRVDTILDGDDRKKGSSGAFFVLELRSKFQSLMQKVFPPAKSPK